MLSLKYLTQAAFLFGLVTLGWGVGSREVGLVLDDPARVVIEARADEAYQLQTAGAVDAANWTNIDIERRVETNGSLEWTFAKPAPPAFYRVIKRPILKKVALQIGTEGTVFNGLGLLAPNGTGFMRVTSPRNPNLYLVRGPDQPATVILTYAEGTTVVLKVGDYAIYFQQSLSDVTNNMTSYTVYKNQGAVLQGRIFLWTEPVPGIAFSKITPGFGNPDSPFPDVEAVAREYVLDSLGILMRWSWNLIPELGDYSLTELADLLNNARVTLEQWRDSWGEAITDLFNADGFVETVDFTQTQDVFSQRQSIGDELLDEQESRLTGTGFETRTTGDYIQDIKDVAGTVVSPQQYYLRGRVIDNVANWGQPVKGIGIALNGDASGSATSDDDGEFGFLLGPGSYFIEASSPGIGYTYSRSMPFAVPEILNSPITTWPRTIHIEAYQSKYLKPQLRVLSITPEKRFVAPDEETYLDIEIINEGDGATSCSDAEIILSDNYSCMVSGSCSETFDSPNTQVMPEIAAQVSTVYRHHGIFRAFSSGEKLYVGGALYQRCRETPVTFYWPEVLMRVCEGNFETLPPTLLGRILVFTFEKTTGEVTDPGLYTAFRFNFDGTVSAYDYDTNNPQIGPSSYEYSVSGKTATLTFNFNNTTGGQTITGTSVYVITLDGKCGGTFTADVQYSVNQNGVITNLGGTGEGAFMVQ